MKKIYILTGAGGHIGNVVTSSLLDEGQHLRLLLHPKFDKKVSLFDKAEVYYGDLTDKESLKTLFMHNPLTEELHVIHLASVVSTLTGVFKKLYKVNVLGTQNLLDLAEIYGVKRFVYVSSVHALPELEKGQVISEQKNFSPKLVKGDYAKTKAIATDLVLSYRHNFEIIVVHPSGVIGPFDYRRAPSNSMFYQFLAQKLTHVPKGGYDFVDVRDVAKGIILADKVGRPGETYILSNQYFEVRELLNMMAELAYLKKPKKIGLGWAVFAAPFADFFARLAKKIPLYSPYSLYTLRSNGLFSHEKASIELGYQTRPILETLKDLKSWYELHFARVDKKAYYLKKGQKS